MRSRIGRIAVLVGHVDRRVALGHLERELHRFGPDVVVVWEYGPAALRTWAWCRRRRVPLVIFSELTPWAAATLPGPQRRLHRWLAARAQGFIAASSAARAARGEAAARARSRWVSGMPAMAGTEIALVMPETTSASTPASRQKASSSPPRPKMYGSPPLSRTTCLPSRASCTRRALIASCGTA